MGPKGFRQEAQGSVKLPLHVWARDWGGEGRAGGASWPPRERGPSIPSFPPVRLSPCAGVPVSRELNRVNNGERIL